MVSSACQSPDMMDGPRTARFCRTSQHEYGNTMKGHTSVKPHHTDGPDDREISGRQSWLWAGINAVMTVFFALAAFVQINDPDPYLWIPIYLIPSLLCCSIVWSRKAVDHIYWRVPAAVHMCLSFVGIVYLTVQVSHHMKEGFFNPLSLEEGRELFGLLIAVTWTVVCWFSGYVATWSTGKLSVLTWLVVLLGMMPLAIWGTCYQSHFGHCNDML